VEKTNGWAKADRLERGLDVMAEQSIDEGQHGIRTVQWGGRRDRPLKRNSSLSGQFRLRQRHRFFAPGVVSGPANDGSPAFSPDGNTIFFTRSTANWGVIVESHKIQGDWSRPTLAPFSGEWPDSSPAMSPAGYYLVFESNRPATPLISRPKEGESISGIVSNLWRVDRVGSGWSKPTRLAAANGKAVAGSRKVARHFGKSGDELPWRAKFPLAPFCGIFKWNPSAPAQGRFISNKSANFQANKDDIYLTIP
jgi:hypothetical protein